MPITNRAGLLSVEMVMASARPVFCSLNPDEITPAMMSKTSHRSFATLMLSGAALIGAGVLSGCHRPQGALMSYSGGSRTYYSTESFPKTVTIYDQRSNEAVFAMDIPVGKQLTFDFVEDEGDDPVQRPDLMRYQVFDIGTKIGRLRNTLPVPNAASRLIDMEIRGSFEYAEAEDDMDLYRLDMPDDRPDWWSPEGGQMPDDGSASVIYDG